MREKDKNRIKQIINENIGLSVEEIYRKIVDLGIALKLKEKGY